MLGYERRELEVLILFDAEHRVLCIEVCALGDVGAVISLPAQMLQRAIEVDARFAMVAHNHPNGYEAFSEADKSAAIERMRYFRAVGMPLVDSLVVTSRTVCSMAAQRMGPYEKLSKKEGEASPGAAPLPQPIIPYSDDEQRLYERANAVLARRHPRPSKSGELWLAASLLSWLREIEYRFQFAAMAHSIWGDELKKELFADAGHFTRSACRLALEAHADGVILALRREKLDSCEEDHRLFYGTATILRELGVEHVEILLCTPNGEVRSMRDSGALHVPPKPCSL